MTEGTHASDAVDPETQQVEDAAGRAAMMGVFGLIILAYACAAAVVLGGLAVLALRLVA